MRLKPLEVRSELGLQTEAARADRTRGPEPSFLFGNLLEFGRDPLAFLEKCVREYGDFVPIRFLHRRGFILNSPEQIESVLATQSRNFRKTIGYRTPFMRRLFGQGLLTSEGHLWQRQRKLAQPAFHRERIATYAATIVEFAERALAEWSEGQSRPIHLDMMRLTTEIVTKTLFNSEVPKEIDRLGEASAAVMKRFTQQWTGLRLFLNLLPTPASWRFARVVRLLDRFIYGLIGQRRASGRDTGDLLSILLQAQDEDGRRMSDRQLRDELVTLMVAGLDTTALALAWAFYLLAKNPGADEELGAELQRVLGAKRAQFNDLPQLRYTEMVIKETMRLYPPAWAIGREAVQDCQVGGERIPGGSSILMSQWVTHRDSRYFDNPQQFVPERWAGEPKHPKFAYFPFGGGPRACIGNSFAMMEAVLVLATVAQRFRLSAPPDYTVTPWPAITLQPRNGIHLTLERRPATGGPKPDIKTGCQKTGKLHD